MNKTNLIGLFLLVSLSYFFSSCEKNIHQDISYKEDYDKAYNYFTHTDNLVGHFPSKNQLQGKKS